MIELPPTQRRELRARAHHLGPVVTIAGNGLAATVVAEIDRSLQAHELIKVRVQGHEREQRETLMQELCDTLQAAPVQHIGNILVIWRQRREDEPTANKSAAAETTASKRAPRPSSAKSAAAFAATARRAALTKASAEKKRAAMPRGRGGSARGR